MNIVLGFICIDFLNSIYLNWWALDSMRESPSKNKIRSDWEDATRCILLNKHAIIFSWTSMCPYAHKYIYYTHNNSNNHCAHLPVTYWRFEQTFSGLSPFRPCPSSPRHQQLISVSTHHHNPPLQLLSWPRDISHSFSRNLHLVKQEASLSAMFPLLLCTYVLFCTEISGD